jgi:hypothetical protein
MVALCAQNQSQRFQVARLEFELKGAPKETAEHLCYFCCLKLVGFKQDEAMVSVRKKNVKATLAAFCALASYSSISTAALAADDLKLKKGISFVQDTDSGFPIEANKMDDCQLEPGKATVLFFGASGDLNTNRQAKRLVDLYKQNANKPVKFILIDVDHTTSDQARSLLKNHYKGYIPFQVILDKAGKVSWSSIGEVEGGVLNQQLDKVIQ